MSPPSYNTRVPCDKSVLTHELLVYGAHFLVPVSTTGGLPVSREAASSDLCEKVLMPSACGLQSKAHRRKIPGQHSQYLTNTRRFDMTHLDRRREFLRGVAVTGAAVGLNRLMPSGLAATCPISQICAPAP